MNNQIVQSQDNIFDDLGFEPDEAANLKIRSDLILDLQRYIKKQKWTQQEAADFFNETQPRISNLMNGDIERFSIDKLVQMIVKTGMKIKVEVIDIVA
ncbi:Helix-turn-helix domain protein [Hyella patelloides LEGE 07179]|uniref:Helix-turn-helix domain protein n=1 Tax=Hyella patelloides LEGE 07179 TaxID=945734 RepID=A0A563VZN2_9CYAN|nr:helix-turn-helix transcriptional regulator [Hyella patelloides]VEP16918.1 Helix-turn-helix domain protein [Hyella patelloides LEGE 07179]